MNGALYFSADDERHGEELWRSDGTVQGTYLVRDINSHRSSLPRNLYSFRSTVFFQIQGLTGAELWKTDGTNPGTVFVKQLRVDKFQDAGGSLYFVGFGNSSYGLWRTDGTSTGTSMISNHYFSSQFELVDAGTFLLFVAGKQETGIELWRADGPTVSLVKDISPGLKEVLPENMIAFKNHLYFTMDQKEYGKELWKSDGTPDGTTLFKDIVPGPIGSKPHEFVATDKFLFFYITDPNGTERLFRTDGTDVGTILLSDVITETGFLESMYKDSLVFITYSPIALWKTDGTPEGTILLKAFDDIYGPLIEANGLLFFRGKSEGMIGTVLSFGKLMVLQPEHKWLQTF
jgi:ELWxxDGT repeat protein